ncbi:MAG: hypothetical protein CMJ83_07515 [Planctomycetes bacterium]|nr:hypothetical protein [Planctomycetota bacterium]
MLRITTLLAVVCLLPLAAAQEVKLSIEGAPGAGDAFDLGTGNLDVEVVLKTNLPHSAMGLFAQTEHTEPVLIALGFTNGYGEWSKAYAIPTQTADARVTIFAMVLVLDSTEVVESNRLTLKFRKSPTPPEPIDPITHRHYVPAPTSKPKEEAVDQEDIPADVRAASLSDSGK